MFFKCELFQETLDLKEVSVSVYKEFLKGFAMGEEVEQNEFIHSFFYFLSSLTNKPIEWVKNLNYLDLFCLLLEARSITNGNVLHIVLKKEADYNIYLDLKLVKAALLYLNDVLFRNKIEIIEDCFVKFNIPNFNKLRETNWDLSSPYIFVEELIYKEDIIKFNSVAEAKSIIEELDLSLYLKLIDFRVNAIRELKEINLLESTGMEDYLGLFPLTLENLIWFCKLLFNEEFEVFLKNFFYLVQQGNFNPQYLSDISVGEFRFFLKCLTEQMKEQSSGSSSIEDMPDDNINDEEFFSE